MFQQSLPGLLEVSVATARMIGLVSDIPQIIRSVLSWVHQLGLQLMGSVKNLEYGPGNRAGTTNLLPASRLLRVLRLPQLLFY